MFSLRRDKYDRLIIGSMGRIHGNHNGGITKRWASAQLKRLFPDLGPVEFENIWYGEIAMTPTHLPGVHQLDHNLFTSIGYNGRGITTGTIFGKALADMISSKSSDCLPLPMTPIGKVSNGPLYVDPLQINFFNKPDTEICFQLLTLLRWHGLPGGIMLLKGRTALITGAAQGIGLACAKAMAADGAHVILADIQQDAVIEAARGISSKACGTFVDIGDKDSILELFSQIENKQGPIDILVNNGLTAK